MMYFIRKRRRLTIEHVKNNNGQTTMEILKEVIRNAEIFNDMGIRSN
jgi:uncharacterized membrane protein